MPEKSWRGPWAFVPTLYFLQGVPYMLVDAVTTTLFTKLKVPVESIGHWSTLLTLPWTLKPLWSPIVDLYGRKRAWILGTQILILVGIGGVAFSTSTPMLLIWTCGWVAVFSATHDIAADGFYILSLSPEDQAAFVGVRSACFRLAMIFVTGAIVTLAGQLEKSGHSVPGAWHVAIAAGGGVYALCLAWGAVAMPRPDTDGPVKGASGPPFVEAVVSYFRQPRIFAILAFILLFRFGESMLTKMISPFLLEDGPAGNLGLTTTEVGLIKGTYGIIALVVGGVLGGVMISRRGLGRCLWPMVIAMHSPNLLYLWASLAHPSKWLIGVVVAVEYLGYGFGLSAYLVYLLQVSRKSRFPTTHYAISTGLMALAAMAASYPSGDLVKAVGFPWFFGIVCLVSLPGMVTLFFIPLEEKQAT